jgi:hypothetical protein
MLLRFLTSYWNCKQLLWAIEAGKKAATFHKIYIKFPGTYRRNQVIFNHASFKVSHHKMSPNLKIYDTCSGVFIKTGTRPG